MYEEISYTVLYILVFIVLVWSGLAMLFGHFYLSKQKCAKCGKPMGYWVRDSNIVDGNVVLCDEHEAEYYAIIEDRLERHFAKKKAREDYLKSIGR